MKHAAIAREEILRALDDSGAVTHAQKRSKEGATISSVAYRRLIVPNALTGSSGVEKSGNANGAHSLSNEEAPR